MMASRAGLAAARPSPTASRASTSSSTAAAAPSTFFRSGGNVAAVNSRFSSVVSRASASEIVDAAADEADGISPAGGRRGGRGGGRGGGRSGGRGRGDGGGRGRRDGFAAEAPEFQERVVQVSRVTKVCTGGKQLSFRAVVVVGDEKGKVSRERGELSKRDKEARFGVLAFRSWLCDGESGVIHAAISGAGLSRFAVPTRSERALRRDRESGMQIKREAA